MTDRENARAALFERVDENKAKADLPAGTPLRLVAAREDGGASILSEVVGHDGPVFTVFSHPRFPAAADSLVDIRVALGDAHLRFVARVLAVEDFVGEPVLKLEHPAAWLRLRAATEFPFAAALMLEREDGLAFKAKSLRLSPDSLALLTTHDVTVGEPLRLTWDVNARDPLSGRENWVRAEVRGELPADAAEGLNAYALALVGSSPDEARARHDFIGQALAKVGL